MNELLFNDLLKKRGIDPLQVVVMRHRPFERELAKVLPWLAADKPDLFNAYQQTQGEKLERTMRTLEGAGQSLQRMPRLSRARIGFKPCFSRSLG